MLKLFMDTEFHDMSRMESPRLISIGLVSERGDRSFYAEVTDTWTPKMCSRFVQDEVLPLLDAKPLPSDFPLGADHVYARMTENELRERLGAWISTFMEPLECWSDAPDFDWPLIRGLYRDRQWPAMLMPECKPLSLYMDGEQGARYNRGAEAAYTWLDHRRHHALDDAKAMRRGYLAAIEG